MNPWDECVKALASFFIQLAAVFVASAFVEPLLRGANILEVRPINLLIGFNGALVLVLLAFFTLHRRKP